MPENRFSRSMVSLAIGYSEMQPKSFAGATVDKDDVLQFIEDEPGDTTIDTVNRLVPGYNRKPIYGAFTVTDFQIGSVRLSTPPIAVGVERLRDISVLPIIRGQAIASKASASVVQITLTLDFPNPELLDTELKPLIAELKTCPFTKLRSYDMAVKLSSVEGFKVSEETRQAQLNVIQAELSKARIRSLISPLTQPLEKDSGGFLIPALWQNQLIVFVNKMLADVADRLSDTKDAKRLADTLISHVANVVIANKPAIISSLGDKAQEKLFEQWVTDPEELLAKSKIATTLFKDYKEAVANEAQLVKAARSSSDELPLMDGFIPVVCQQVVLASIPGRAGAFRVNFTFEYFFHDNYVNKMQYHTYNELLGWDVTDDPAEADLLLRWRDIQYLGIGGNNNDTIGAELSDATPSYILETLNDTDSEGVPGFLKLMQKARFSRVCRSFPSDPNKHSLNIFYPENMPRIEANAQGTNTGAIYKGITIDTADAITDSVISNVQIMWNLNVARHTDEHSGVVRHQWAGGSTLSASFELCIPHDGLPEAIVNEGGRILIGKDIDSAETNPYARLVGRINNMFSTMERNRKLLPSDAFIPTSIFVDNPVTALFGAYVFELKDIPMFQSDPGKVTTVLNFVEALPVIGLAGDNQPDHINTTTTTLRPLQDMSASNKFRALLKASELGFPKAQQRLRAGLFGLAHHTFFAIRKDIPSLHKTDNKKTFGQKLIELESEYNRTNKFALVSSRFVLEFVDTIKSFSGGGELPLINEMADVFYNNLLKIPFQPTKYGVNEDIRTLLQQIDDQANPLDILLNYLITGENAQSLFHKLSDSAFIEAMHQVALKPSAFLEVMAEAGHAPQIGEDFIDFVLSEEFRDPATDVLTQQLYPDMILPRYYEILGIDPDTELSDSTLLRWIPSMSETGKLDFGNNGQFIPSRDLGDIVDPDIYFIRERTFRQKAHDFGFTDEHKGPDGDSSTVVNEAFASPPDDGTGSLHGQPSVAGQDAITTNVVDGSDSEIASGWAKIEAELQPNDRRMLYAFPTYSMEFFLDIQHSTPDPTDGVIMPGNTSHFEARLLNILPLVDLEIYEDAGDRPNIATLTFIARRAGLRNNSWQFLTPRNQQTVYDSSGHLIFTNDIDAVKQHLNEFSSFLSDPMLLTTKLLTNGTRVSIKIGYGTDLNNSRMLPTKISGSIAEISLGETSQMVVQSFGTQLANPINTEIGGSGRYSPNKVLSGSLTLRAFSDIFHALDMRFMGRTGRGIDIDARNLSNADIERIALITYQTRTFLNVAAANASGYLQAALNPDAFYNPIRGAFKALVLLGFLDDDASLENTRNFLADVDAGYLNPYRNFYPEFLNVKGPPIGISDWAISNTSTMNLSAATWIDMISRLNPGTIWWPHTYGDEVRLFWGKPESIFRAEPGTLDPDLSALTLQFMNTKVRVSSRSLHGKIRDRVEDARYSSQLIDKSGTKIARISPGYVEDLTNPFEKNSISDHINFLLSNGLTQDIVGRLIRQLMVSKINDIEKGLRFLREFRGLFVGENRRSGLGGINVVDAESSIDLTNYLDSLVSNSYNHIFPSNIIGFTSGQRTDSGERKNVVVGRKNVSKTGSRITASTLDSLIDVLARDTLFNFRFGSHPAFLNTLRRLEQVEWTKIDEDLLTVLSITNDDINVPGTEATMRNGNYKIEGTQDVVSFGVTELKALRFLLERVLIDLNFLYKEPTKLDNRVLDESIADSLQNAARTSVKALRSMRLNGYRPFRSHHIAISGHKLMASHIEATQAYMANAVSYDGYTVGYNVLPEERRVIDLDSEMSKLNFGVFEWFKGLVGKNERDRVIDVLFPSTLAKGLSKMYRGELILIGDPWIKPHDILYILDLHNGIYGPVCCETVINKLSVQTGLVTIVRPAAITQAQSSRFLTDYLVRQRQMKTIVGGLILTAIAAAFIPGVGLLAAAAVGGAAAIFSGVIDIVDVHATAALRNVQVIDPLTKSLSSGKGANARTIEDLVNIVMVESYVSGTGLFTSGMAQDRGQLLERIKNAKDQLVAAQLGVSMVPLKRLATHTPFVAGLRTHGFETIEIPSYGKELIEGVDKPLQNLELAIVDTKMMIEDTIQDFNLGLRFIKESVANNSREIERLEDLFRERGIELE